MVPICIRIVPSYGTPLQSCSNFKKKKIRNELLYQLYARVGNQEFSKSVYQSLFRHHSTGSFWRRWYDILISIRSEIQGQKSITFWPLQFNIFMSQSMFYLSTSIVFLDDSLSRHISIQGWYECYDNFFPNIWMSQKWIWTLKLPNFIIAFDIVMKI